MIALPNAPQSVTQGRTSATAVTHTLGEVVREITQNHRTDITLRGVSGLAPRSGQTRDGGVSLLGGRTILEEFDRFLDDYQTRASHDAERVFLVYRSLNEGYAFRVEPLEFRWMEGRRAASTLVSVESSSKPTRARASDPRGSILSPVTEMVRAASQYVALAGGAVSLAQNAITNVHGELEEARELLRSIESVVRIISETAESADGLTRFFSRDLPRRGRLSRRATRPRGETSTSSSA